MPSPIKVKAICHPMTKQGGKLRLFSSSWNNRIWPTLSFPWRCQGNFYYWVGDILRSSVTISIGGRSRLPVLLIRHVASKEVGTVLSGGFPPTIP